MRLQLALIASLFSSVIFALAIGKDIENDEPILSKEALETFLNEESFQNLDIELSDPAKYFTDSLTKINHNLKSFTHEKYVSYDEFENKKELIYLEIRIDEKLLEKYGKDVSFTEEMKIIKRYYNTLQDSFDTRKRFEGCEYPGADWVEEVMDENVKAMSLYFFKTLGENEDPGFYRIFTNAKSKVESIESKDKTKLAPAMQEILTEQIKQAKESLEMLEKLSPTIPSQKPLNSHDITDATDDYDYSAYFDEDDKDGLSWRQR